MKKTVLTFGLISGAVSSAMMLATLPFEFSIGFGTALVIGYTTIVLSSLVVFFGVRSYRENVGAGRLTLGRGLAIGLLITLISCACYVGTWEILYFKLMPDFGDRYAASMVERVRAAGASPAKIVAAAQEAQSLKRKLDNPLFNAAMTFIEPFPIGLVVTAVSAAMLRKR